MPLKYDRGVSILAIFFYLVSALSDPGYVTTYVLNEYEDDIENMKNYAS